MRTEHIIMLITSIRTLLPHKLHNNKTSCIIRWEHCLIELIAFAIKTPLIST